MHRAGNQEVFAQKHKVHSEEWVLNGGGEVRLLSITKAPKLDHKNNVEYVVCSAEDITERKEAEKRLIQSEERFQKMLSLIPDMISTHDPDMNIIYSNWSGFGAVPEEKRLLNTKCYWSYRGRDDICPDCQAVKVLQTKEAFQKEVKLTEGNWVDLHVIPILGQDGSVELFVEWVRDITKQKQAERDIQNLVENAPDMIVRFNTELEHIYHRITAGGSTGYHRPQTAAHTQGMRKVAKNIGEKINLTDTELSRLDISITMHDIGK